MSTVAITRSVRAAGLYRSASRTVPAGITRITLAIDSDWTSAYDVSLFGIEVSFDGGTTWQHTASVAVYGGARDRFGNPPTLTLTSPAAGLYRLFALLSSAADLGITVDIV